MASGRDGSHEPHPPVAQQALGAATASSSWLTRISTEPRYAVQKCGYAAESDSAPGGHIGYRRRPGSVRQAPWPDAHELRFAANGVDPAVLEIAADLLAKVRKAKTSECRRDHDAEQRPERTVTYEVWGLTWEGIPVVLR